MKDKLLYLTKNSLDKKLKSKWFYIANFIFLIIIVCGINIEPIINFFGGEFKGDTYIYVIDEVDSYNIIEEVYNNSLKDKSIHIEKDNREYDALVTDIRDSDKSSIILEILPDMDNIIRARLTSNKRINIKVEDFINNVLKDIKTNKILEIYDIDSDIYKHITRDIDIESINLKNSDIEDDMVVNSLMLSFTFPIVMLVMFLIQMIGAEINEEKNTRSMEIIISNVSPKIHLLSKLLSANIFVLIQGLLLFIYSLIGIVIMNIISGGIAKNMTDNLELLNSINITGITNTFKYMLPIMLVMIILTFICYSLLAAILASMTMTQEDFQQLQTPLIVILLISFYLSMIGGVFSGSKFIKIMSYIPFFSQLLSPSLYIMGEISIYDLLLSIILLIITIYILIKYGLRIYRAGILNYEETGLWKKMFRAMKEK